MLAYHLRAPPASAAAGEVRDVDAGSAVGVAAGRGRLVAAEMSGVRGSSGSVACGSGSGLGSARPSLDATCSRCGPKLPSVNEDSRGCDDAYRQGL